MYRYSSSSEDSDSGDSLRPAILELARLLHAWEEGDMDSEELVERVSGVLESLEEWSQHDDCP